MNLTPTEIDRLIIFSAAEFARRNRRLGIRLSHPEAVALLTDEAMIMARQGLAYDEIRDRAYQLLTDEDVESGVRSMVRKVLVELPMVEGTKLLALLDPILATGPDPGVQPGEVMPAAPQVEVVAKVPTIEIEVTNLGDRDIQVRSHTHFFEVNRALAFDRDAAFGRRLAVPAGSGVRFEPGIPKRIQLIEMRGNRDVRGFADLTGGSVDDIEVRRAATARAQDNGYIRTEQHNDFD